MGGPGYAGKVILDGSIYGLRPDPVFGKDPRWYATPADIKLTVKLSKRVV